MEEKRWILKSPKGLREYILKTCQEVGYVFFSNKSGKAICTACEKEWDISEKYMEYFHNPAANYQYQKNYKKCPCCGHDVIVKAAHYGKGKLKQEGFIIWFAKRGKTTFAQKEHFLIKYDNCRPKVYMYPVAQYRFTKQKTEMYRFVKYCGWISCKNVAYKFDEKTVLAKYKCGDYIYEPSLENIGTDLKYADIKKKQSPYVLINYIKFFLKNQSIELLEKGGFEKIVKDRCCGLGTKEINWRGKSLTKILKATPKEVRDFRKAGFNISDLEKYRKAKSIYSKTNAYNFDTVLEITGWLLNKETVENIKKYTSLDKAIEYLHSQAFNEPGKTPTLNDFEDYLGFLEKLGLKIDKKSLYPKDFWAAHDALERQVAEIKEAEDIKLFRINQLTLTKMDKPYRNGDYLIRPAIDPQELRYESKILNHCVRTYIGKVSKGETSILFIRAIEAPDTPLYTLEWRGGRVVQCRGKNNCSYTDDVADFIKKWEMWMLKKSTKATADIGVMQLAV